MTMDLLPQLSSDLSSMIQLDFMVTTYDNPYNPYDDYDSWLKYDEENGYNTNSMMALLSGDDATALDQVEIIERQARAIEYMIDDGPIKDVWTIIKKGQTAPLSLLLNK